MPAIGQAAATVPISPIGPVVEIVRMPAVRVAIVRAAVRGPIFRIPAVAEEAALLQISTRADWRRRNQIAATPVWAGAAALVVTVAHAPVAAVVDARPLAEVVAAAVVVAAADAEAADDQDI
jgi:hypothetical protein